MQNPQQQQQQPGQEEEQPRMNIFTMMLIFLLIRNLMSSFMQPAKPETPASIIERYNQTYTAQKPTEQDTSANPVSSIFGLMKGMMPVNKGIKGKGYMPILKDGAPCVYFCVFVLLSLCMCMLLSLKTTVRSMTLTSCTSANPSLTVLQWNTTKWILPFQWQRVFSTTEPTLLIFSLEWLESSLLWIVDVCLSRVRLTVCIVGF